jgi:hypothetical protein
MVYMEKLKEKKSFYFTPELREAFEDSLQTPHEGSVHAGAALLLYLASPSALKALARDYSGRPDVKQAIKEFLECLENEGPEGPVVRAVLTRTKRRARSLAKDSSKSS